MKNDLTEYAVKAYKTRKDTGYTFNPHIPSSPAYYAHEIAIFMGQNGMTEPKHVKMSRGYSIWANDMLFKIHETRDKTINTVTINFERIK